MTGTIAVKLPAVIRAFYVTALDLTAGQRTAAMGAGITDTFRPIVFLAKYDEVLTNTPQLDRLIRDFFHQAIGYQKLMNMPISPVQNERQTGAVSLYPAACSPSRPDSAGISGTASRTQLLCSRRAGPGIA